MTLAFTKMHGAGNDFVVVDNRAGALPADRAVIAAICHRRRGVGADGLIAIERAPDADFAMRYWNADGGEADLCGNGARCAARFAADAGIAGPRMAFRTRAGILRAEVLPDRVRVDIAPVRGLRLGIPIEGLPVEAHFGICGVPHAVLVVGDVGALSRAAFVETARPLRSHPVFGPAGANVNLVSVEARDRCSYRTYERGVEDETEACGTGSVVVTAVLAHLGLADPPLACRAGGGDVLTVDAVPAPGGAESCRLSGPAVVSFRGTLRLEEYGSS